MINKAAGSASMAILRPERHRPAFYTFTLLNTFSFIFLSGSILTLIALSMGASGTYIGILGALTYLAFFFMPLGRWAIRRQRIIAVFGWSWMFRYWGMIPSVAAPFLALAGAPRWGLALLLLSAFLFNFFRGTGLIGNNPVVAFMAGQRSRGAFLSTLTILNSLTAIGSSAVIALVLAKEPGPLAYTLLLVVGILSGIVGTIILLRLPEPEEYRPPDGTSMLKTVREAFKDKDFRRFMWVFTPLSFAAGTVRTFIITHAHALYSQSDGLVMLYAVSFNLGIVVMGFVSRRIMDRLGAKPLFALFGVVAALAMLPLALSPTISEQSLVLLFLLAVNFIAGFGVAGQENAGQAYFFSLVKTEHVMDLAVVYYVILGLGGTLGSFLGGVFLDLAAALGASRQLSYQGLYGLMLAIIALATMGISRLSSMGSITVRQSLGVLFSLRDLKAIGLLDRLGKSRSPGEELEVIREIGSRGSPLAESELLPYLSSPRFDVRIEALLAIENLDKLSQKALKTIHQELVTRPWSSAYLAARLLGKWQYKAAIPELRKALEAEDYMLQSAAVLALARLGDQESRGAIERIADSTQNPRLLVSSVAALETLGSLDSVPVLVAILRRPNPPSFAFDEIVLALAGMLGGLNGFYRLYSEWLRDEREGVSFLMDRLSGSTAAGPSGELFRAALEAYIARGEQSPLVAKTLIELSPMDEGVIAVLTEACLDAELASHRGFRFFLAACAIAAALATKPKGQNK
ncbi:MAG TPA: MFS transporter [Spirochaetaceae bacterium]|nr:MFS transporter [Spirochaetaceae bacterium]